MSGSSDPTRPFVLIAAGQSNIGFDNGGPKTVGPNILISNHLTNPTGFAPARFGVAPLNLGVVGGKLPLAWVTTPEEAFNNIGIQFANLLRASGLIPEERPIVVIPNWFPGQSIGQWIEAGTASRLWKCLRRHTDLLGTDYPGCRIDHTIWAQGESDSNIATSAYNTRPTYAAGFATLLDQFRQLPQWAAGGTTLSVQELARWPGSEKFDSRNDVIAGLGGGGAPEVTVVSSQGLTQSRQTLNPHFDAASILELARRHYDAWLEATGSDRAAAEGGAARAGGGLPTTPSGR
jgi:hypothetical protein